MTDFSKTGPLPDNQDHKDRFRSTEEVQARMSQASRDRMNKRIQEIKRIKEEEQARRRG